VSNPVHGAVRNALLEQTLLAYNRAIRIGAIQVIDYRRAIVITNDRWKEEAGGIPQHTFLLAFAREVGSNGEDDDEVLLLRVDGSAPLSSERDLQGAREEALRDALSKRQDPSPSAILNVETDSFARNRALFTGLECRIIGTFYEENKDGITVLEFGHDVDNFYATATYEVFKPIGDGLSSIVSYIKPTDGPTEMMRIGAVRYSSTRRRSIIAAQGDIPVKVNINDFIANKTGMFGMTRMGKSDTIKSIVACVFAVSERRRAVGQPPVGQLIIDAQGEYANSNTQDERGLAAIGHENVVIYKFGADGSQVNVRPLGFNFYDPNQIEAVTGMISSALADAGAQYVRVFTQADFVGLGVPGIPQEEAARREAQAGRGRLILYGALAKAGFTLPLTQIDPEGREVTWRAWTHMRRALADELEMQLGPGHIVRAGQRGRVGVEQGSLVRVIDWVIEHTDANDLTGPSAEGLLSFTTGDPWQSALPLYSQNDHGRAVSGFTRLRPLRSFHAPSARFDYRKEIYNELVSGKIVIVDLHLGPDNTIRQLSDNLAAYLMECQTDVFASNFEPPYIQMTLEDAHNLFSSERYRDELDVWARMVKQASKLNIGMLYATRDVTGVDHQVLANTNNWLVAHLNNYREINELGRFYDFKDFGNVIVSHDDRGYIRLKTMSSPYIIPVQIDRYGIDVINYARAAAGLPPLTANKD
jgi:hypothetical protein